MNISNVRKILNILLATIFISSCWNSDAPNLPLGSSKGKPDPVTNIAVKNIKAGAIITYAVPHNPDLQYVKAVYTLSDGSRHEVKASKYTDTLKLMGFGDTLKHKVALYAVNKAEVTSDSMVVNIKPLENPIFGVFRSMSVEPDFSGIRIRALNRDKYNVAIEVYMESNGNWKLLIRAENMTYYFFIWHI